MLDGKHIGFSVFSHRECLGFTSTRGVCDVVGDIVVSCAILCSEGVTSRG
jgi:hypothetical protein